MRKAENIDVEKLIISYNKGLSDYELGEKFNINERTIRSMISGLRTIGKIVSRRDLPINKKKRETVLTERANVQKVVAAERKKKRAVLKKKREVAKIDNKKSKDIEKLKEEYRVTRGQIIRTFRLFKNRELVASKLGLTKNKLTRLCGDYKIDYLLLEPDVVTREELITLLNDVKEKRHVATKLGVSTAKITKLCQKYNLLSEKEIATKFSVQLTESLSKLKPYKGIKKKPSGNEHFVVHFTDWHAGKRVVRENDKVTFDIDIFKKRVDSMLDHVLYLLEKHVTLGSKIGMIDILNTGDFANGEGIYPTQQFQQMIAPPEQVMLVVEAQIKFVKALIKAGYPVRMHCVMGNHGRTGKDTDPSSNWDIMIYKIIDFWQRAAKVDHFEIIYTESDYLNTEINGWKYHLRHIAFEQGDTASARSKFHGWGAMHDTDSIVYGHWHHWGCFPVDHIRVFRGGSLVGPDEFSDKLGKCSEPIQLVWGVPKNRVSSFVYPVDLTV